ncbi:dipeptide epimerase [Flavihumibacter rivuli]|uniref:mandelate racemase/muconate lactonizing enzyme family protein n=1 Tax=Flavihumibacter rivuli TaxID=2838156 RepID=UPI001BDDEFDE|nr:dipeptide epimerase [Flavihumibacter rivuli]ULQ58381.1 dipeptide epimerase [Flavihumibacter rivuli]
MKILSYRAWLEHLPLTKPYTIAYKTTYDTEVVFLEFVLDNGIVGLGASNPFEDVVGETPAQALENLQSGFLGEFIGRDIRHFNQLIDMAAQQFPDRPGTVAAVDIALHDAFGKFLGVPVLEFYGKKVEPLPTSITIGIKPVEEMVEEARTYRARGFRRLKIKTGLDVDADIERVVKLSEAFGDTMKIRVDANQGYGWEQLRRFIRSTSHLGLELIEQPLPSGKEGELTTLPAAERQLLVADESLINARSALQWSQQPQPFGVYNIKLMKCGGVKGAFDIANIARQAGISLFWGCNDESIVSISAALHAAYACPNTRYLDLDGSFDLAHDLVSGGFRLSDGILYPTAEPGFGYRNL